MTPKKEEDRNTFHNKKKENGGNKTHFSSENEIKRYLALYRRDCAT